MRIYIHCLVFPNPFPKCQKPQRLAEPPPLTLYPHATTLLILSSSHYKSCTTDISTNPPNPTFSSATYLVKNSHRLISTPNLHLVPCSLPPFAVFPITLNVCLRCIIPLRWSAKDIIALHALKGFTLIIPLGENVLVRTGKTFEAVGFFGLVVLAFYRHSGLGDCEYVGARGADWRC